MKSALFPLIMFFAAIIPLNVFAEATDCNSSECIKFVSYSDNFLNESNVIYCSDNCESIDSNKEFFLYVNRDIVSLVDMQSMLHEMVKNIMKEDGLFYSRFKGQTLNLNNFSIYSKNNTDTPLFKGNVILKLNDFARPTIEILSDILSVKYEYYFQKKTSQKTFVGKYKLNIPEKGWTINQIFKDYEFPDQFPFDADKFKITGEIESFIFMKDIQGYYFRISNVNILDIDKFMKGRFAAQILREMDIPDDKHGVRGISFDLNIFNEEVVLENIKVDSNLFQVSGGRIVIEDSEIASGTLPLVPGKIANSRFFEFLFSKTANFKELIINLSGDYFSPEILFSSKDAIVRFYTNLLINKNISDKSSDFSDSSFFAYKNFKDKYSQFIDSNNQDLSVLTMASLLTLFKAKSPVERAMNLEYKDDMNDKEIDFLYKRIKQIENGFLDEKNSDILTRSSNLFYKTWYDYKKDQYNKVRETDFSLPQFEKEYSLWEYIKNINDEIEENMMVAASSKILNEQSSQAVEMGEFPVIPAGMIIITPQLLKGGSAIAYKSELKILQNSGIAIAKEITDLAKKQILPAVAGEFLVPKLEAIHDFGHYKLSKILFGDEMRHVHRSIDSVRGGLHRTFNHDISTVFKMGRKYGTNAALATAQHHFQDFFSVDGVRTISPEIINQLTGKTGKSLKRATKTFFISSGRLSNGIRILLFTYDAAKAMSSITVILKKNSNIYFKIRKIRIALESGVPLITRESDKLLLRLIGKRVPVVTLSGVLNVAFTGWFFYDMYFIYKEWMYAKNMIEPEFRKIMVFSVFGDELAFVDHSRKIFNHSDFLGYFHACSELALKNDPIYLPKLEECRRDIDQVLNKTKKDEKVQIAGKTFLKKAFLLNLRLKVTYSMYESAKTDIGEVENSFLQYSNYLNEIDMKESSIAKLPGSEITAGKVFPSTINFDNFNMKATAFVDFLNLSSNIKLREQNVIGNKFDLLKDLFSKLDVLDSYVRIIENHFKMNSDQDEAVKMSLIYKEFVVFRDRFKKLHKNEIVSVK